MPSRPLFGATGALIAALLAFAGIAEAREPAPAAPAEQAAPQQQTYTVQSGDTLFAIAQEFGTTVEALVEANDIANPNAIFVGQGLDIPGDGTGEQPVETTYTVQSGDTLFAIAQEFGTSVDAIVEANDIANPNAIFVGQELDIPGDGTGEQPVETTYTVQSGDTLFAIAQEFGTSVEAIAEANDIANPDAIFVGDELTIPGAVPPLTQNCVNESSGYTVDYPEGWSTNPGDVVARCSYFDPEPFEVPEATEFTRAINMSVEALSFDGAVGHIADMQSLEVISQEQTTVAGRDALVVEAETTGDAALFPPGTRSYRYIVDLDERILEAITYDFEDLDFDTNREILDAMMETLEVQ